jgi:hypothetical protein
MDIWYILWLFGGIVFPVLVCCTKNNLATLHSDLTLVKRNHCAEPSIAISCTLNLNYTSRLVKQCCYAFLFSIIPIFFTFSLSGHLHITYAFKLPVELVYFEKYNCVR